LKARFKAVAFDLDGTLYPNHRLYALLIPFFLKEQRLLRAFGKARTLLRDGADAGEGDFYTRQAYLAAHILKSDPADVQNRIERLIYRGWEPLFSSVRLYPRVLETLNLFRDTGIRLGLLSDMPPETKLLNLGIDEVWDAVICSERTGFLKPHPAPFAALADALAVNPAEILYVGNSQPYDAAGAVQSGMSAALIRGRPARSEIPVFSFHDYRTLCTYVLR
jgi:putative hydrolase of the HAD superfamily